MKYENKIKELVKEIIKENNILENIGILIEIMKYENKNYINYVFQYMNYYNKDLSNNEKFYYLDSIYNTENQYILNNNMYYYLNKYLVNNYNKLLNEIDYNILYLIDIDEINNDEISEYIEIKNDQYIHKKLLNDAYEI